MSPAHDDMPSATWKMGDETVILATTAALLDAKAAALQHRIGELQGKEQGKERRKVEKELKSIQSGAYWFSSDDAFVEAVKAAEPAEKEAREQAEEARKQAALRAEEERKRAAAAEAERAERMAAEQRERERLETIAAGGLVIRHVGYEGSVTWRTATYTWLKGPASSTFEVTCHTTGNTEQWTEGKGDKPCAQPTPRERSLQLCPWCGVSRGVFVQSGQEPPVHETGPGGMDE